MERRSMTRMPRGRRGLAKLIAVAPIAAIIVAFGAASPVSAGVITGNCPTSGVTCFWKDINYMPTNEKLSLVGTNGDWTFFGSHICPSGNWNDCASSVQNRFGDGTTMFAWTDIHCQGSNLAIVDGRKISDLGAISGDWNDHLSSDRISAGSGC
jgi:hypothetical protein